MNKPNAYDVIISLRPHSGDIHVGLRINAVDSDVPAADHKRVSKAVVSAPNMAAR